MNVPGDLREIIVGSLNSCFPKENQVIRQGNPKHVYGYLKQCKVVQLRNGQKHIVLSLGNKVFKVVFERVLHDQEVSKYMMRIFRYNDMREYELNDQVFRDYADELMKLAA